LKTADPQGFVGSNPTPSASFWAPKPGSPWPSCELSSMPSGAPCRLVVGTGGGTHGQRSRRLVGML